MQFSIDTQDVDPDNRLYFDAKVKKLFNELEIKLERFSKKRINAGVAEDAPANTTANIAIYSKPLKFKLFKRKLEDGLR